MGISTDTRLLQSDDSIHEVNATEWMRTDADTEDEAPNDYRVIIGGVLAEPSLSACNYDSLRDIILENPISIESSLHEIFNKILLQHKRTEEDRNSYNNLMNDILDACIQLRKHKKIVTWILITLSEVLKVPELCEVVTQESFYILPQHFLGKFSESVSNLAYSQVDDMFISIIHHLRSCLLTPVGENNEPSLTMSSRALVPFSEVLSQLITAIFDSFDIFNSTWSLAAKRKFQNRFASLGKILAGFVATLQQKNDNEYYHVIMLNLWNIMKSWQTIAGFIKQYDQDAFSENNGIDLSHTIENFREFQNKGVSNDYSIFLKLANTNIGFISNLPSHLGSNELSLVELPSLDCSWNITVDEDRQAFYNFKNDDVLEVAKIACHVSNKLMTMKKISTYEDLVTGLIFDVFMKINDVVGPSTSTTKSLLAAMNNMNCWKSEMSEATLRLFKNLLVTPEWTNLSHENALPDLIIYLNALLNLPLMYCAMNVKTIIFLTTFSIKKETLGNSTMDHLCTQILFDIAESYREDLLQYIHPKVLIIDLLKSHDICLKILEGSLMSMTNYATLEVFVESQMHDRNIATTMVECVDKVISQLKISKHQDCLKKIGRKLLRTILADMDNWVLSTDSLKMLTVAIKTTKVLTEVDDSLTHKIHTTLQTLIGTKNQGNSLNEIQYTRESYQFIQAVLQFRSHIVFNDSTTIEKLWILMLQKPCVDLVSVLIDITDMTVFDNVLNTLSENSRKSLRNQEENTFHDCMTIWYAITKADMGVSGEKIRQVFLYEFIQEIRKTRVPMSANMKLAIVTLCAEVTVMKRTIVPKKTLQLILIVVNAFINEGAVTLSVSHQLLYLCCSLLKFRTGMAVHHLPIIMRLCFKSIRVTAEDAETNGERSQLQCLSILEIQKFTSVLVKLRKDIHKISPYVIADLMGIYHGEGTISQNIKELLEDLLSALMSICDQNGIYLLFRVLPPSLYGLFKTLHNDYVKFWKFVGKI